MKLPFSLLCGALLLPAGAWAEADAAAAAESPALHRELAVLFQSLRAQEKAMRDALFVGRGEQPRWGEVRRAAAEFGRLLEKFPTSSGQGHEEKQRRLEQDLRKLARQAAAVEKYARLSIAPDETVRFFRQLQIYFRGLEALFPLESR